MPSKRGGRSTGCFRVIPTVLTRLARCWTSLRAGGKASLWGPRTPSRDEQTSIQARRRAIPRCLPRRAARPISQTGGVLNVEIRRTRKSPQSSVLMEGRRSALSRYPLFRTLPDSLNLSEFVDG